MYSSCGMRKGARGSAYPRWAPNLQQDSGLPMASLAAQVGVAGVHASCYLSSGHAARRFAPVPLRVAVLVLCSKQGRGQAPPRQRINVAVSNRREHQHQPVFLSGRLHLSSEQSSGKVLQSLTGHASDWDLPKYRSTFTLHHLYICNMLLHLSTSCFPTVIYRSAFPLHHF